MDQQVDLTALSGQHLDPEVFRRVWNRVMPDQKDSPIMINQPADQSPSSSIGAQSAPYIATSPVRQPSPMQTPAPIVPVTPAPITPPPMIVPLPLPLTHSSPARREVESKNDVQHQCEAKHLSELMELALEGAATLQLLSRRVGNGRTLSGLLADWRKILRQLSTAYFLATGQHYQPKGAVGEINSNVALALRERFYWEERWAKICIERAEQTQELTLRELYHELAQSALVHAKTIRSMLERM